LFFLFKNNYRLFHLIDKYKFELIFLIITGYFLYSFKYDFFNLQLSFNSFIIYIANNILKESPFKGIELVFFFLTVYFVSINLISIITNRFDIFKLERFFLRIIMWTLLLLLFNYMIYIFKINLKDLKVFDIIVIPILIAAHSLVKFIFTFIETFIKKKYADYFTKYLVYIIIDSIFIFFSIIVGSVYTKIGILNTSFFIAFLAVIIMLVRYISSYNYEHILYYSINSFINVKNISPNSYLSYLPLKKRIDFNHYVKPEIEYLLFIMVKLKDGNKIHKDLKERLPKEYNYYLIDLSTIVTVVPSKDRDLKDIEELRGRIGDCVTVYSFIDRVHWRNIEISYIFKSFINILKNMKDVPDIVEIDEDIIF
nr:hypothetical protein [Spirochaetota bacterium]